MGNRQTNSTQIEQNKVLGRQVNPACEWLVERESNRFVTVLRLQAQITSFDYSNNGRIVCAIGQIMRIYDFEAQIKIGSDLIGHTDSVGAVKFSQNGVFLVSGSFTQKDIGDFTVRVWDSETQQQVSGNLIGHTGGIQTVAFSPNGLHVVSGSAIDSSIRVWDWRQGTQINIFPFWIGSTIRLQSLCFAPDGENLMQCYHYARNIIWKQFNAFESHMKSQTNQLFIVSQQGISKIFRISKSRNPHTVHRLFLHAKGFEDMGYLRQAKILIFEQITKGTVYTWDSTRIKQIRRITQLQGFHFIFSLDQKYILAKLGTELRIYHRTRDQ